MCCESGGCSRGSGSEAGLKGAGEDGDGRATPLTA